MSSRRNNSRKRSSKGGELSVSERENIKATLRQIVARSGLLSEKIEPTNQYMPIANVNSSDSMHADSKNGVKSSSDEGGVIVLVQDEPSTSNNNSSVAAATMALWNRWGDLPTLETLEPNDLPPMVARQKLLSDLRLGDVICAAVVHVKIIVLELRLLCMMARFRRCLSAFMPNERFVVCYNRSKKIYQNGDYVMAHVKAIDASKQLLELVICEDEAILRENQLPAYYRKFIELVKDAERQRNDEVVDLEDVDEPSELSYEGNDALRRLRGNANLPQLLSLRVDASHVSALSCFAGRALSLATAQKPASSLSDGNGNGVEGCENIVLDEAGRIREAQNRRLAMSHVERGAELTRAGRCFEAIQCFNRAMNVDEHCADAYVGRGAACAGCNNFPAALSDLEKALELEPKHRNAQQYRIEVLIAFGKSLEKYGKAVEAIEKYSRAFELSERTNERAANALQRLGGGVQRAGIEAEVITLDDATSDDCEDANESRKRKKTTNIASSIRIKSTTQLANNNANASFSQDAGNEENRRKLRKMEEFIASLRKSK